MRIWLALMFIASPLAAQQVWEAGPLTWVAPTRTRPEVLDRATLPRFTPTVALDSIFVAAKNCTGKKGDLARVTWLVAPGREFVSELDTETIGLWVKGDTIVLAREWLTTGWLYKHELIHFLIQGGHLDKADDDALWGDACRAKWGFLDN